jgi:hypothetical protein
MDTATGTRYGCEPGGSGNHKSPVKAPNDWGLGSENCTRASISMGSAHKPASITRASMAANNESAAAQPDLSAYTVPQYALSTQ